MPKTNSFDHIIKNKEADEKFERYINIEIYPKEKSEKENLSNPQFLVSNSLFCGAIAGILAKTVIAPGERIKMTFQVSQTPFSFKAAFNRLKDIVKREGIASLWRGHSTTVMRVGPYAGLSYAFHDSAENLFKNYLKEDQLPPFYKFLAGSIAGFGATLLTYPLDVLRVRLALGSSWSESIKHGGLYQGLLPTLLGIVPYAGTAWTTKQTLLENFNTFAKRSPSVFESLLINAIAGLAGQFVSYPLDIVRRRMQIAKRVDGRVPSLRSVLYHLYTSEGLKGISKGFSLNIIKGPISLSISLTSYDILMKFLSETQSNSTNYS